jgi:hypothetical protein
MRFCKYNNWLLFSLVLLVAIFNVACSQTKMQSSEPIVEAQQIQKQVREIKPCQTEPVYGVALNQSSNKNLEAAWKQFTASGQYRLACDTDADFSLDAIEPKTIESYSIDKQSRSMNNWGNWNYPKRTYEDHLAAIVVDTTRTEANRFGLVVFSPPRIKKTAYDINWLYEERDLTRASVGMSSGSVWVEDYTPDGKRSFCWILWNREQKIFECGDYSVKPNKNSH